jgi:hypothetical protein
VAPEVASVLALSAAELAAVLVVAVELELEPQAARPRAAAETPATFKKLLLEIFCMIIYPSFLTLVRILRVGQRFADASTGRWDAWIKGTGTKKQETAASCFPTHKHAETRSIRRRAQEGPPPQSTGTAFAQDTA